MTERANNTAIIYGIAGLIPFVACTILVYFLPEPTALLIAKVFVCYSTVILSFLSGILWGTALQKDTMTNAKKPLFAVSIGMSLLAWVTLVIVMLSSQMSSFFLTAAIAINALAFYTLRVFERRLCDIHYPEWFTQLRNWLTPIVVISHFSIAALVLNL
ncbi:MAG: hypothetical protein ACI9O6_002846 [Glaciecola sp.]|jgi:hypothetical protein